MSIRPLSLSLGLFVLAACAGATIDSVTAPEALGKTYHNVLVMVPVADLGLLTGIENRLVAWSSDSGTRFVASHQIFFPGRNYSGAQVKAAMQERGIDAILVLQPTDAGTSTSYIAPSYKTTCTVWTTLGGCSQVTTSQSGGETVSKPWATFSARLTDASSDSVVWIATGSGGGNAFAGMGDVFEAIADRVAGRLAADGLARPRALGADSATVQQMQSTESERSGALQGRP